MFFDIYIGKTLYLTTDDIVRAITFFHNHKLRNHQVKMQLVKRVIR